MRHHLSNAVIVLGTLIVVTVAFASFAPDAGMAGVGAAMIAAGLLWRKSPR